MEADVHAFLYSLGRVQKGLESYSKGKRPEGNQIIETALATIESLLTGPEWSNFFTRIADYLAGLEITGLETMKQSAADEAGLLKRYGLTARDLLQLHRFYKIFTSYDAAGDWASLFISPEAFVTGLRESTAAIKKEVDRTRSLPRKLKKKLKQYAQSRLVHLLAGSGLVAANLFLQKEAEISVSIGVIFLNSAIKNK